MDGVVPDAGTQREVDNTEAGEDLQLILSPKSKTGYKHVYHKYPGTALPYAAEDDTAFLIGKYKTAIDAARAYARWLKGVDMRVCSDLNILQSNMKSEKDLRYLVQRKSKPNDPPTWQPVRNLPPGLINQYEAATREARNMAVEPALAGSQAAASGASYSFSDSLSQSGVEPCLVAPEDAERCARFLNEYWSDGALELAQIRRKIFGYATYGKTLEEHDEEEQRTHTLLFTHSQLPLCRLHVPGFVEMEEQLARWLHERFGTVVSLYFAHGLRQGPETLKSTGFDVHQDTEEFDFIEYTVVVKLTADAPGEPPSRMRVIGAQRHFAYGPAAGSAGCFRARLYHASVAPESPEEHLKVAFFFRSDEQGERRLERGLKRADAGARAARAAARKEGRGGARGGARGGDGNDEVAPRRGDGGAPPNDSSSAPLASGGQRGRVQSVAQPDAPPPVGPPVGHPGDAQPAEWTCAHCALSNSAERKACAACRKRRRKVEGAESDWESAEGIAAAMPARVINRCLTDSAEQPLPAVAPSSSTSFSEAHEAGAMGDDAAEHGSTGSGSLSLARQRSELMLEMNQTALRLMVEAEPALAKTLKKRPMLADSCDSEQRSSGSSKEHKKRKG